jgi:UDP-N-acetyl-D-glucosamine dehydrogenase
MSIGIVGLGYVGLPLAVAFAEAGTEVIAVDVDARKVEALRDGESYIEDVDSERLEAALPRIDATSRYAKLARADAILICVPTPLSPNREPDLEPLLDAARSLADVLQAGQVVILESTTYPGTTRERLVPALEVSGLVAGEDFHVAFSPERVDPGRTDFTLRTTPKVVGGLTDECADRAEAVYALVCEQVVRVSSPDVAELSKLLENIFRSVNIALVNELSMLTERMDLDVWEVIDAAATKPYGFMPFEPGPGMGGHCLPVDPFYLTWRAREFDFATEFIELAGKINQQMPHHCVQRIQRALNGAGKPVQNARVAVIGVAYKPGSSDTRESPALKIIGLLMALGAEVSYHDPFVPELESMELRSEELAEVLDGCDVAVIITAHSGVDHDLVGAQAPLLVDFRGITRRRATARRNGRFARSDAAR